MKPAEPTFLLAPEAALFLRYEHADGTPNMNAFYVARHRHQIKAYRRGGKLLFRRADLEAFLHEEDAELEAFKRRSRFNVVHAPKVGGRAR